MPGDMHLVMPVINHLGALAIKLIDGAVDEIFVPGNGRGGDHHQVARRQA